MCTACSHSYQKLRNEHTDSKSRMTVGRDRGVERMEILVGVGVGGTTDSVIGETGESWVSTAGVPGRARHA